jgi:hypothetical protein
MKAKAPILTFVALVLAFAASALGQTLQGTRIDGFIPADDPGLSVTCDENGVGTLTVSWACESANTSCQFMGNYASSYSESRIITFRRLDGMTSTPKSVKGSFVATGVSGSASGSFNRVQDTAGPIYCKIFTGEDLPDTNRFDIHGLLISYTINTFYKAKTPTGNDSGIVGLEMDGGDITYVDQTGTPRSQSGYRIHATFQPAP